ncbi:4429_t:CDS:1, partial [Rhizophagus irregularis]
TLNLTNKDFIRPKLEVCHQMTLKDLFKLTRRFCMSCGHNVKLASCYVSREKKKFSKTQIQETNLRANTLVRKQ